MNLGEYSSLSDYLHHRRDLAFFEDESTLFWVETPSQRTETIESTREWEDTFDRMHWHVQQLKKINQPVLNTTRIGEKQA